MAVQSGDLVGHGLPQWRQPGHRRILVVAVAHRLRHGADQGGIAVEVRKALPEVDGPVLAGQRRHGGEDGGADIGQAAGDGRRADGGGVGDIVAPDIRSGLGRCDSGVRGGGHGGQGVTGLKGLVREPARLCRE